MKGISNFKKVKIMDIAQYMILKTYFTTYTHIG